MKSAQFFAAMALTSTIPYGCETPQGDPALHHLRAATGAHAEFLLSSEVEKVIFALNPWGEHEPTEIFPGDFFIIGSRIYRLEDSNNNTGGTTPAEITFEDYQNAHKISSGENIRAFSQHGPTDFRVVGPRPDGSALIILQGDNSTPSSFDTLTGPTSQSGINVDVEVDVTELIEQIREHFEGASTCLMEGYTHYLKCRGTGASHLCCSAIFPMLGVACNLGADLPADLGEQHGIVQCGGGDAGGGGDDAGGDDAGDGIDGGVIGDDGGGADEGGDGETPGGGGSPCPSSGHVENEKVEVPKSDGGSVVCEYTGPVVLIGTEGGCHYAPANLSPTTLSNCEDTDDPDAPIGYGDIDWI